MAVGLKYLPEMKHENVIWLIIFTATIFECNQTRMKTNIKTM